MKHDRITKVVAIRPVWTMSVCTVSWQPTRCLLKHFTLDQKCQPAGGSRGKVRGSPKSSGFIIWQPYAPVQLFVPIHEVLCDILLDMWKCWPAGGAISSQGNIKSLRFILWGPWIPVPIHGNPSNICYFSLEHVVDRPTSWYCQP